MSTESDVKDIGLTEAAMETIRALTGRGWFSSDTAAAKFCMALAIRAGEPAGRTEGAKSHWALGNFDSDFEIRTLLSALYPDDPAPGRLLTHLINRGLEMVAPKVSGAATSTPIDLFEFASK